jgi:uncharacterized protein (DUF433 family)
LLAVADLEFTTTEAALLTEQPVNRIQKYIDAGPIPKRSMPVGNRQLRVLLDSDLMFIWVVTRAFAETDLDARLKAVLYDRIAESRAGPCSLKDDEVKINSFVAVRGLQAMVSELRLRIEKLEKARAAVVSSTGIKGGELVLKGTRIPVYLVAAMLEQGATVQEILESYPTLDAEKIELAQVYARANPKQGRPPKHPWR